MLIYAVAGVAVWFAIGQLLRQQSLAFPQVAGAVWLGIAFGQLSGPWLWQARSSSGHFAAVAWGCLSISVWSLLLCEVLGGPTWQWWSGLAIYGLITRAAGSVLPISPVASDEVMAPPESSRLHSLPANIIHNKNNRSPGESSASSFSIAQLLTASVLFAVTLVITQAAVATPSLTLKSLAWFGSLALIVATARAAGVQFSSAVQRLVMPKTTWQRNWAVADALGIIGIVLLVNMALGWVLLSDGIGLPHGASVLWLCVSAQAWQGPDLAVEWIAKQTLENPRGVTRR